MNERKIELSAGAFHIREWGMPGAPRILMLHGFPEYSGAWEELGTALAPDYHCIAPDQRGYGQSPCPEGIESYGVAKLVGDMAELIENLGGPLIVVGHDWGAAVAYGLAFRRPDLVSKLIIMNGVHPAPFQAAIATGGAQCEASQYINALRRPGVEERLAENEFERMFSLFSRHEQMAWFDADRRAAYHREWARPGRLTGMLNWYRASPIVVGEPGKPLTDLPEFPREQLRVRMPHLLIWGDQDIALLPESTEGLEAFCDDLTRVSVPDADHWIAHRQPERVEKAIRDWLA